MRPVSSSTCRVVITVWAASSTRANTSSTTRGTGRVPLAWDVDVLELYDRSLRRFGVRRPILALGRPIRVPQVLQGRAQHPLARKLRGLRVLGRTVRPPLRLHHALTLGVSRRQRRRIIPPRPIPADPMTKTSSRKGTDGLPPALRHSRRRPPALLGSLRVGQATVHL